MLKKIRLADFIAKVAPKNYLLNWYIRSERSIACSGALDAVLLVIQLVYKEWKGCV